MAAYKYRALDSDGKLIKGVLEGDSERQIRAQLRTKSLRPIEVTSAGRRAANGTRADSGAKRGWFAPRLSASELALVTRQLATLVASALPLDECIQAAAEQTRRASTKHCYCRFVLRSPRGTLWHMPWGSFRRPLVTCTVRW